MADLSEEDLWNRQEQTPLTPLTPCEAPDQENPDKQERPASRMEAGRPSFASAVARQGALALQVAAAML